MKDFFALKKKHVKPYKMIFIKRSSFLKQSYMLQANTLKSRKLLIKTIKNVLTLNMKSIYITVFTEQQA